MTGPENDPLPPDNRAFQELHNRFAIEVDRSVTARSEAGLALAIDRYRASDTPKDEAWAEERVRQALSAIRGQPQTAEAAWAFILGGADQTSINNEGPLDIVTPGSAAPRPVAGSGASSNGKTFGILAILAALAIGAYLLFGQGDDKGASQTAQGSQGIRISAGQPLTQAQLPQQTRTGQPQTASPAASAGDQIVNVTMQFTQSLVRTEGRCPPNVPAAGFDFSPKTTTKVTINKTKRTIVIENTDGTKSDVATYDAATGLAVITYQGAADNRSSIVKVTDAALDGESSFFPYRTGGSQQFPDCKFVLKTSARVA